jgi:indolepyruvate ferredoxin oxidoreductase beta subunit
MAGIKNIVLCGVGGQGTILASKLLSNALLASGQDVKMSEIHGMSQRGGSVTTQVRYGVKVHSPVIGRGSADILVAFEKMEALRYLEYLKPEGVVVVNDFRLDTSTILAGLETYPADPIGELSSHARTRVIDAAAIATALGSPKAMNLVLLGALAALMGLEGLGWEGEIRAAVKPGFVELDLKALRAGAEAARAEEAS